MRKRALEKFKLKSRVFSQKTRTQGVLFGAVLFYLFWGSLLLLRAGDVELNPGPVERGGKSTASWMQTRLSARSGERTADGAGTRSPQRHDSQGLGLADLMAKLNSMDSSMNDLQRTSEDPLPIDVTAMTVTAGRSGMDSLKTLPCSSGGKEGEVEGGLQSLETPYSTKEGEGLKADSPGRIVSLDSPGPGVMEDVRRGVEEEREEEEVPVAMAQRDGCCLVTQPDIDHDSDDYYVVDLKSLHFKKLSDSSNLPSDSSGLLSDLSTDSNSRDVDMDHDRKGEGRGPQPASQGTESADSSDGWQGLVYGKQETLVKFVTDLRYAQRGSGIHVWNGIVPVPKKGVLRYEENKEFLVEKVLQQREKDSPLGVYLCQDKQTKKRFIIKKIESTNHRVAGTEFLVTHQKSYLPQIYAVYKEKDVIWIFQEYIPYSLTKCGWDLRQIYEGARCLLSACRDLHAEGLAHCDLKPANVMVRDPHMPDSLVLIDFESAKHRDPKFCFKRGGHTHLYLPPWHRQILHLKTFDPVLMTADLWAIACLLIRLIAAATATAASKNSQSQGHNVWAKIMGPMQHKCPTCRRYDGGLICSDCQQRFLNFLEKEGRNILSMHLEVLMMQCTDDVGLHWAPLRQLLEYLTDCTNIDHKNVDDALHILTC